MSVDRLLLRLAGASPRLLVESPIEEKTSHQEAGRPNFAALNVTGVRTGSHLCGDLVARPAAQSLRRREGIPKRGAAEGREHRTAGRHGKCDEELRADEAESSRRVVKAYATTRVSHRIATPEDL
jgi:hypothetical protein